jgi:hypothetical protein
MVCFNVTVVNLSRFNLASAGVGVAVPDGVIFVLPVLAQNEDTLMFSKFQICVYVCIYGH